MLLRALQVRKELPPLMLVRIGEPSEFVLNDAFLAQIGVDVPTVELDVTKGPSPLQIADVMRDFARLVDLHRPAAVVVVGSSDAALACGLVASKTGCRLAHLEAGQRSAVRDAPDEINRVLLDRMADAHCTSERAAYDALLAEGASESRLLLAGSLLTEAVSLAVSSSDAPAAVLARADVAHLGQYEKQGYCVVLVESAVDNGERRYLGELLAMLRKLSRDVPIVWPMSPTLGAQLESLGLRKSLRDSRIAVVEPLGYVEQVSLLGGARCVLTDSADVREEAAALDVPSLLLEMRSGQGADAMAESLQDMRGRGSGAEALQLLRAQARTQAAVQTHEAHAAERIAEHLARWVAIDDWSDTTAGLHAAG
jgi:UDP-N-acetylglucosamine 2-epimerase (non-hydrolysing)